MIISCEVRPDLTSLDDISHHLFISKEPNVIQCVKLKIFTSPNWLAARVTMWPCSVPWDVSERFLWKSLFSVTASAASHLPFPSSPCLEYKCKSCKCSRSCNKDVTNMKTKTKKSLVFKMEEVENRKNLLWLLSSLRLPQTSVAQGKIII